MQTQSEQQKAQAKAFRSCTRKSGPIWRAEPQRYKGPPQPEHAGVDMCVCIAGDRRHGLAGKQKRITE